MAIKFCQGYYLINIISYDLVTSGACLACTWLWLNRVFRHAIFSSGFAVFKFVFIRTKWILYHATCCFYIWSRLKRTDGRYFRTLYANKQMLLLYEDRHTHAIFVGWLTDSGYCRNLICSLSKPFLFIFPILKLFLQTSVVI